MTAIAYSRGRNAHDVWPAQKTEKSFDAFIDAQLADGTKAKSSTTTPYICGPLHGNRRRGMVNASKRAFLVIDMDRCPPELLPQVRSAVRAGFRCAMWPTHTSTPAAPRYRVFIELSREVDRDEGIAVGRGLIAEKTNAWADAVRFDESTFRAEQPVYAPPAGAVAEKFYEAQPLDVDRYLRVAAALPPPPRSSDAAVKHAEWKSGPDQDVNPSTIEPDDEKLIDKAQASKSALSAFGNGISFADCWTLNEAKLGEARQSDSGDAFDRSDIDYQVACELAYQTGCDPERIERIMLGGPLERDKYHRHDGEFGTYLRRTILKACGVKRAARLAKRASATVPAPPVVGSAAAATVDGVVVQGNEIVPREAQPIDRLLALAQQPNGDRLPATLQLVITVLLRQDLCGVNLRHDRFKDVTLHDDGKTCRPISDVDVVNLRTRFDEIGFKPVSGELMRDAILSVADKNAYDSAIDWGNSLIWDGVPRIAMAMTTYFGATDSAYVRAVALYLFTAFAGRLMDPGCQADMAPVLVGAQGLRKSTGVAALAPLPDAFAEISFDKLDDDLARKQRGVLVVELAELRGLRGRDAESIRTWLVRRFESWVPKWREHQARYARRSVCVGTSNEEEFLDDPHGNRRWLPVLVGAVDSDAIKRDRDQLWAEGIALWRAEGIQWQEAEALAKAEHEAFKVRDIWTDSITAWLAKPPPPAVFGQATAMTPQAEIPFTLVEVLRGALSFDVSKAGAGDARRLGAILRAQGFRPGTVRDGSDTGRRWRKVRA